MDLGCCFKTEHRFVFLKIIAIHHLAVTNLIIQVRGSFINMLISNSKVKNFHPKEFDEKIFAD